MRLVHSLLLGAVLMAGPIGANPAWAEVTKVTVTVVLMPGGKPIAGILKRKGANDQVTSMDDIDASGTEEFDETDCSSGTRFLVTPYGDKYTSDGQWKSCRGDRPIPFVFYAGNVPRVIAIVTADPPMHWGSSSAYASAFRQIKLAHADGEYGTAAVIDADLGERLKSVNLDAARGFKEAATVDALTAIMQQTGQTVEQPLTFDPVNKLSVPTSDAEDLVKLYQTAAKLPVTGKLDWTTVRSLSPLGNEGLYEATLNAAAPLTPAASR